MIEILSLSQILILVVGFILSMFVFIFSNYALNRNTLKTYSLFDISIILILFGIIFGRLVGMLNSAHEYIGLGFNFFPLEEINGKIMVADAFPWQIFKITDGNFFIWGFSVGILLGLLIIYYFSNRTKGYFGFADNIVLAFLPAQLFLLIFQLISFTYYANTSLFIDVVPPGIDSARGNLALIEIIFFIIVFIGLLLIRLKVKSKGLIYLIFFGYELIVGAFLVSNAFYSNEFIFGLPTSQFISILITFFIVLILLVLLIKQRRSPNESVRSSRSSQELIYTSEMTDIEMSRSKNPLKRFFKKR